MTSILSNQEQPEITFEPVTIRPIDPGDVPDEPVPGAGAGTGADEESLEQQQPGIEETAQDLLFLSETIWSIPNLIWNKLPPIDSEKVLAWNEQLFKYCQRKGLSIWDYVFDELPLIISTFHLGMGIYQSYRETYGKKEVKRYEKGEEDYEHWKAVSAKKEGEKGGVEQSEESDKEDLQGMQNEKRKVQNGDREGIDDE